LLTPPRTESQANFVFFDAGRPQAAKASATEGVLVGRTFAPYVTWLRITIGFPGENARA
jgi:histidinol-phosphate aminotransferase